MRSVLTVPIISFMLLLRFKQTWVTLPFTVQYLQYTYSVLT